MSYAWGIWREGEGASMSENHCETGHAGELRRHYWAGFVTGGVVGGLAVLILQALLSIKG